MIDDRVELRGLVLKAGAIADNDVIATISVRPQLRGAFATIAHNSFLGHNVELRPDGSIVVVNAAPTSTYCALEGITTFTLPQNDAYIPLAPVVPFVDSPTDVGFAPSAYIRTLVDTTAADTTTVQSVRVALKGGLEPPRSLSSPQISIHTVTPNPPTPNPLQAWSPAHPATPPASLSVSCPLASVRRPW